MKKLNLSLICLFISVIGYSQGTQLLRQPTISKTHIVFVYANDLWQVGRDGGDAIRLTSNEGYESNPHYSPDEKWIAFSAQYDGNTDVYVIPSEGGSPKRLTWHPGGDFVQGWTPQGEVLFRSGREGRPTQTNKFFTIGTQGGLPKDFGIPRAAYGEISNDGSKVAYTPITGWDPEWRNYRGGQAMPIWVVDLTSKELIRAPQTDQERHLDPVWFDNKVYYLSERDYAMNIWMFDPASKEEKQITFNKQFDTKGLDACDDAIVYEMGGYLHLLNPNSGESKQLEINVKGDMNFARHRWETVRGSQLTNANISPNGKRVIFNYRGEVFTVPKKDGSWRNTTNTPGEADRNPIWSPDGNKIAWFSDKSGEYQLVIADQKGQSQKSISLPNPTFYFRPDWSSDGNHIAYTDTDYNIWFVNVNTGSAKKVDTDLYAHPNRAMNPVWSPDGKWIAYAKQLKSHFKAIFAYNIGTGERIQLTDGIADAISPIWDQSGKYMYFLASTDYGLSTGWLDMSSYDPQTNRSLYCLLLNNSVKTPLAVKSDEEDVEKPAVSADKKKGKKGKSEDTKPEGVTVSIDKTNINKRIIALDLPSSSYVGLIKGPKNSVFVAEAKDGQPGNVLHKYDLNKLKVEEYFKGVQNVVASYDGSHILYRKGSNWYLSDAKAPSKKDKDQLKLGIKTKIDPQAEYHQIFKEGWRYMRDFLYVTNQHGAPWNKVYEWYAPWINHVRHRTDLNYVLDIMSGEIAVGHSYVRGGDMPDLDYVPVGLLGCDFEANNGYYRFKKIYTGENWNPGVQAPLHQPGAGANEGEYLLAVNGKPVTVQENPYSYFEQTAGRATTLTVNSTPSMSGSREIIVKPASSEFLLRRWDWVESNRRKVDEMSGGKLAYIYVPNTGGGGFTYFNRYYFSQQDRKGAVIDERNNGGGSAADYMIDIMNRKLFGYFNSPVEGNRPWTTPMAGLWGPKVMIINERAGSGGDLLPYMFKAAEIGPLVGTRTWGGLVGTWDTPRFIDGGRFVAPRGGFYDADGNWAVEGEGIAPDIEVIQEPKMVIDGQDPQLERAILEALRLLEQNEFQLKPEPAAPVRWKRPEGFEE